MVHLHDVLSYERCAMSKLLYPYGFVYETTCIPTGMKYIGSHRRLQDSNDPDDSWYLGSSTNPQFWEDLEEYGRDNFRRDILEEIHLPDKKFLKQRESHYLKKVDARRNPLYYNRTNCAEYGGGATEGSKLMHKGEDHRFFTPDEIPEALADGWVLGASQERIALNSVSHQGQCVPESVRKKISETLKGDSNPMNVLAYREKVAASKLGTTWIHNELTGDQKYVRESELDHYYSIGYRKGMLKRRGKTKKDYDCSCRICGSSYKGGKYSSVCPNCYSEMKSLESQSRRSKYE